MTIWRCLAEELNRWSDAGKTATFWWRDDDAVAPTPQLEALIECAKSIPLALAVIPQSATIGLAERLQRITSIVVMQHGWAHSNHATMGRNEYPSSRTEEDVSRELMEGRRILTSYFREQAIAVFVPPWHGFDDRFLPLLPQNGIMCISRKGPRVSQFAAKGLSQINVHVAPIKWTSPRSFGTEDEHLSIILDHLRGRRTGHYDCTEPTGLLTHHIVQDHESYKFIARLIDIISQHSAGKWLDVRDVLPVDTGWAQNVHIL